MKHVRLIVLVMLAVCALALAGCSATDANAPANTSSPTVPAQTMQPAATDSGALATEMPAATSTPSEPPAANGDAQMP